MTVMITGGAGYIGSHTVHEFFDADEDVIVLDDLSTGFATSLPHAAKLVTGNVGDQSLVASLIRAHNVEAIIHFAGSIVLPESVSTPLAYYQTNTGNSRSLLETAVTSGVRFFIFSSTAAVYGNPARVPVDEDAPLDPISPYGW